MQMVTKSENVILTTVKDHIYISLQRIQMVCVYLKIV